MGETGGDRRGDRPSGGGGISITGASRQHAQTSFFDRPWLVMGAVAAGIGIGVGIMMITDAGRGAKPVAHPSWIAPPASPASNGIDVDVRPETTDTSK